jgi:hypothetical protein
MFAKLIAQPIIDMASAGWNILASTAAGSTSIRRFTSIVNDVLMSGQKESRQCHGWGQTLMVDPPRTCALRFLELTAIFQVPQTIPVQAGGGAEWTSIKSEG